MATFGNTNIEASTFKATEAQMRVYDHELTEAGTRLFDGYSIPSDTARTFWCYHALTNTEIVQAFAGTNNVITLTLGGDVFS